MNVRAWQLPFRIGATSYVVEDDLLANAYHLAPIVQDMQLVLFDIPGGPSNLPDAVAVAALAEVGRTQDLTSRYICSTICAAIPISAPRTHRCMQRNMSSISPVRWRRGRGLAILMGAPCAQRPSRRQRWPFGVARPYGPSSG